jgi:hypothetical protein
VLSFFIVEYYGRSFVSLPSKRRKFSHGTWPVGDLPHEGQDMICSYASQNIETPVRGCATYSYRNASVGFKRDARLAGSIPKSNPTVQETENATNIE